MAEYGPDPWCPVGRAVEFGTGYVRAMSRASRGQPEPVPDQLSPDGRWRWDGREWVPADDLGRLIPPPPPPPVPQRAGPQPRRRRQPFTLSAWVAIGLGAALFATTLFFDLFFFPAYPLRAAWVVITVFGLFTALWAIRRGALIGGVIGIMINLFAGMFALVTVMQS